MAPYEWERTSAETQVTIQHDDVDSPEAIQARLVEAELARVLNEG